MLANRPVGQGAASKKYDVLTALGAYACANDKFTQRRVLRFVTMVTARYNWQRNELAIGRAELARLWQIDERSVKRDMARLKAEGWLLLRRPPARGRVAIYAIDWARVLEATRSTWLQVGPDFAERVGQFLGDRDSAGTEPAQKVVPFPMPETGQGGWGAIRTALRARDPAFFTAWVAPLSCPDPVGPRLLLQAPSAFHASYLRSHGFEKLEWARASVAPEILSIEILSLE